MDHLKNIVRHHYDIDAVDVTPQQGGWAALAYKVISHQHSYFLKVYEKSRASTPKWTALIDKYVPIIQWLSRQTKLHGKLPVPLLTRNAAYKHEDDMGIYQLFLYIEGKTIGSQALSSMQVRQLAEIIAELHLYGEEIPVSTAAIKEDFRIPFAEQFREMLNEDIHRLPNDVDEIVKPFVNILADRMNKLEMIAEELRGSEVKRKLCHTDIHNWNLMQSGQQLILIDWEGLKLAPVEADLMFLVDQPFFEEFMTTYRKTHTNYVINRQALEFYQIRRRLEDICELLEQLLFDEQEEQDRVETIGHLKGELSKVDRREA
ncbi:aminoglycoside phosphotransferase family protein [Brevibacillus formosus]|uniref:aminoglycoside phosphotransferase family protein n=1 Tax=Brevibacillus TaxID=55080 RepID=UPI000D10E7B4|nr:MULTISPECIES: aminoglycoside phosphotransferase family protein [Brevibacillus]MBG9943573.1 kinase [Brevibacillus formosus]MED1948129.1 aminoglycoside phosphotransferase family protein [Brevibacillus formosus]MED1998140.1 aminoglycoside phosphotransferase family protein [Brevibacillus formosus]MED2080681.1 aminoglycoside phosphotransferase family protein [Brevibacillus formosus]PSK20642.1 kinase [Brevibacillus sp. NRRL NRS-603]